jgi:ubiquinone/menaquinone biosynthesis C-methylase UbiE
MKFNRIFELLESPERKPQMREGILDFVPHDCPHKKIGKAYDKAAGKYDDYILGKDVFLRGLKKFALGLDKEASEGCAEVTRAMLSRIKEGIVLDIPAGTGLSTFEEYVKYPNVLFVAAEYSWGMLRKAQEKVKQLDADNILLVRADVGNLPFKAESFDAVLCLNGIHSFPQKEKAVFEMGRVLKNGKRLHGSMILKGERWLTDVILELAYFRLLWFTRPALNRKDLLNIFEKSKLKVGSFWTLKAAAVFEAVK